MVLIYSEIYIHVRTDVIISILLKLMKYRIQL